MRSCGCAFQASVVGFLHNHIGAVLVGRVVQQASDIVNKQWVEQISDLFLVRKFQRTLKRNPGNSLAHRMYLAADFLSYQTPFKCIGPILTT